MLADLVEKALQELIDAEAISTGRHERTETRTKQTNNTRPRVLAMLAADAELRI
ncbi:MAG: hypothetical protein WED83_06470 [Acidimicrobiia bacterium]